MTSIEEIRLKINDHLKPAIDKDEGDGSAKIFALTHHHIQDYTVTVEGAEQTENTDYVMDAVNGQITFTTAPTDGDSVVTQYKYAGFTDAELQNLLDLYESVNIVIIEAIKILMFDAARQFDYKMADEAVEPSQIFKNLKQMLEMYQATTTSEGGVIGAYVTPRLVNRINPHYKKESNLSESDISTLDIGLEDED